MGVLHGGRRKCCCFAEKIISSLEALNSKLDNLGCKIQALESHEKVDNQPFVHPVQNNDSANQYNGWDSMCDPSSLGS